MLKFLKHIKSTNSLYLITIILVFGSLLQVYISCRFVVGFDFLIFIRSLADCMICYIPVFFLPARLFRRLYWIPSLLLTIFLSVNIYYYHVFGDFIMPHTIRLLPSIDSLTLSAGVSLTGWREVAFIIVFICSVALTARIAKSIHDANLQTFRWIYLASSLAIAICGFASILSKASYGHESFSLSGAFTDLQSRVRHQYTSHSYFALLGLHGYIWHMIYSSYRRSIPFHHTNQMLS